MTTRPELIQCCQELDIDYDGLSSNEMETQVKLTVDKLLRSKKIRHSADKLSITLRKFLTIEYDYKIYDKKGNILNYRLEVI